MNQPQDQPPLPPQAPGASTPASVQTAATTPAQQLDTLRLALAADQRKILEFEPLKTSIADLVERIATLEAAVAVQAGATAEYVEFYRAVERYGSEIACGIATVRTQLKLSDKQVACIEDAIDAVDTRLRDALDKRAAQDADVKTRTAAQQQLDADLDRARRWRDFLATGLAARVNAQRDDLKALSLLADPATDPCNAWFYVTEMDAMLQSARASDGTGCYDEALNLATFLECWTPASYDAASAHWIVAFNDAERAQKIGMVELAEATRYAADLAVLADTALAGRRDAILKEIKAQACCAPLAT